MAKTILIIEDVPELRMLLVMALSANPHYIIIDTDNGFDGLKLFEQHKPDLIITDMSMPKMSGFQLIRTIRATGSKVKILAYSALFGHETEIRQAYEAGADLCLTKPIELDTIESTVSQLLTENPN